MKKKDYEVLREDHVQVKVQTMKMTLKMWKGEGQQPWQRLSHPNPNNFFERIQNAHLLPVLVGAFILLVFCLSLAS